MTDAPDLAATDGAADTDESVTDVALGEGVDGESMDVLARVAGADEAPITCDRTVPKPARA